MNDVVDKHAVTWVASAGNHGPALGTIGAPPDISKTTIIGNNNFFSNNHNIINNKFYITKLSLLNYQ